MAETLGSLVDKLTIKSIRTFHIKEATHAQQRKRSSAELKRKLTIVEKQKSRLLDEIQSFIHLAAQGKVPLREEKFKLYNKPEIMGKVSNIKTIARAIEKLGQANIALWQLEDEARREDVDMAYIGKIKRKIDHVNQRRNDLIDRIDELFEQRLRDISKRCRKKKT